MLELCRSAFDVYIGLVSEEGLKSLLGGNTCITRASVDTFWSKDVFAKDRLVLGVCPKGDTSGKDVYFVHCMDVLKGVDTYGTIEYALNKLKQAQGEGLNALMMEDFMFVCKRYVQACISLNRYLTAELKESKDVIVSSFNLEDFSLTLACLNKYIQEVDLTTPYSTPVIDMDYVNGEKEFSFVLKTPLENIPFKNIMNADLTNIDIGGAIATLWVPKIVDIFSTEPFNAVFTVMQLLVYVACIMVSMIEDLAELGE